MDLAAAVAQLLPDLAASSDPAERAAYAWDSWPKHLLNDARAPEPRPYPELVVWPERDEHVAELVSFARREGIALVPYGAGSGVCGAVLPGARTIVVDTKRLLGIAIDRDAGTVAVGAGVMGIDLEDELERRGFTVGHFPSSILCSTVGGWLAARGAGQCSSRYGKIEDMVTSADCVLGTGDEVTFTRRAGGPNPLALMLGSEGTLGLVTRARLRLHAAPAARHFAGYRLESFEVGALAMRTLMQAGLRPSVLRLYDPLDSFLLGQGKVRSERQAPQRPHASTASLLRFGLGRPRLLASAIHAFERFVSSSATLVVIFEGSAAEVEAHGRRAAELLRELDALPLGEGPARAWFAHRYAVSYRQSRVFLHGAFNDTLEVAAPWSRLAAVYEAVRGAASEHAMVLAHLSHAYADGCSIYFTLVGTRVGRVHERYAALIKSALGAALSAGATLSHHHGVGRSKAALLDTELGGGMSTLRRLRRAWDPDGVLNPGALDSDTADQLLAPDQPLGIDERSGIGTFAGSESLPELEARARALGLSLDLAGDVPALSVAEFLNAGLPGIRAPEADPVRSTVVGLTARSAELGFRLLPAPRRAVGPDLTALCVGARGKLFRVERASLALSRLDASSNAARAELVPLGASETMAWQLVERAFKPPA